MAEKEARKIDDFVKTVMEASEEDVSIPFWSPQEGDVVVGRITNITTSPGEYGNSDVYTIYNELLDSYVKVSGHAMLTKRLRDFGATVGDRVGIKYLGKKKGKNKREYNLYAVFVDEKDRRAEGAPKASASGQGQNKTGPFDGDDEIPF